MPTNARAALNRLASRRTAERHRIVIPGRVTWRDSRGMTRFATVVTRDVSESGVYLDCRGADAIPLYRLVYLQLDRGTREVAGLPPALRDGRVLSAVYRVGPCEPTTGTPSGYALRLLVDPGQYRAEPMPTGVEPLHFRAPTPYDADVLKAELSDDDPGVSIPAQASSLGAAESLVL